MIVNGRAALWHELSAQHQCADATLSGSNNAGCHMASPVSSVTIVPNRLCAMCEMVFSVADHVSLACDPAFHQAQMIELRCIFSGLATSVSAIFHLSFICILSSSCLPWVPCSLIMHRSIRHNGRTGLRSSSVYQKGSLIAKSTLNPWAAL